MRDSHSRRPYATLTTARSQQIGEALGIRQPVSDDRCTACHAPMATVAEDRRPDIKISEGVSCENCHGPAEQWLRGHTRHDWTHDDRTTAGMRDMKNLYERVNTCVACHQTVELPLLKAGHPELIFEMDGQCASEPRHWRESSSYFSAKAWFIGQAAAARELSWQVSRDQTHDQKLDARQKAAVWLVQKAASASLRANDVTPSTSPIDSKKAMELVAVAAAKENWSEDLTRSLISALGAAAPDFEQSGISQELQARRAERLVLGLDRLLNDLKRHGEDNKGDAELDALFKLAQSIPDFDPKQFAQALKKFEAAIRRS